MAMHVTYEQKTYKPPIPDGNLTDPNPLEFDIIPAFGQDMAKLRSVIVAAEGVTDNDEAHWTPEVQKRVIGAFESGRDAFAQTVTLVRGLTIDAAAALRVGIIPELPQRDGKPDPKAAVPITTGRDFAKICTMMRFLVLSQLLALEIIEITAKSYQLRDGRFFAQPSGSGGPATGPATTTTARNARRTSRRRGTVGDPAKTDNQPPGTSAGS